ncbi:MAG: hypothetical protein WKF75_04885 [Singulisphaera sp.]
MLGEQGKPAEAQAMATGGPWRSGSRPWARPPRHRPELQQPGRGLSEQGKPAEAEAMHRRAWRSGSRPWAKATPTPPGATTAWARAPVSRGSMPRPRR